MSATRVKIPDLTPLEYKYLMEALNSFCDNRKALAVNQELDAKIRSEARSDASLLSLLISKVG